MEDLKALEIRINKLRKKISKQDAGDKKITEKLHFLLIRADEVKKSLMRRGEIDSANKNTIKSHEIKAVTIHKRKAIDGLAAKVTNTKGFKK